ncbi:PREDICTED: dynactin subunit 6 [Nicrophorus vespilloides]|uniref:Dynactin subunit 6 n=1 Tax=Nicrophorus vespilloides TaxID=110193 RepID=A0ABM1MGK5_NICVS|nr:PREDICTED: dynactin subunit 6 [Nicrophorus vespilloides]
MSSKQTPKISSGALVCGDNKMHGDITFGTNSIVHPSCTISAESGPIIFGDTCIIEEQAKIIHRVPFYRTDKNPVMFIGSNNVFEIDCTVEAAKIGNNNIFEPKCFVGNKVTITDGCVIGAGCVLTDEQVLPKNTIVHGSGCKQREALDQPNPQFGLMDTLMRLLPNYHHIRKPIKKP